MSDKIISCDEADALWAAIGQSPDVSHEEFHKISEFITWARQRDAAATQAVMVANAHNELVAACEAIVWACDKSCEKARKALKNERGES